ncbi:MAG: hypothetical protein NTX32_04570 [Candidatus Firestonebacteria bacterium]|nr:hypothetical protein [Candidatus Firestonebacteria bacterium]
MVIRIISAIVIFYCCAGAEDSIVVSSTSATSNGSLAVTVPGDLKPQLEAQGKEIEKLKAAQKKLDELGKSNLELQAALKALNTVVENHRNMLASTDKGLDKINLSLETVKEEFAALNKKSENDSFILDSLKVLSDSCKVKLEISQDDIKVKSDEIKALKEVLSILKANIDSNIADTIELKRVINEIKARESGRQTEGIISWEYLGVVTSGVAVLALVLAIVK